jgi:hypothetical protein
LRPKTLNDIGWGGQHGLAASVLVNARPEELLLPLPSRIVPDLRSEIPPWLDQWRFTRFVTLAMNDSTMGDARLPTSKVAYGRHRDLLREWDGRINHAILGRSWAKRHSDRIWAFYSLEKPRTNPHWHGLIRFFPVENMSFVEQERIFDENTGRIWKKLVPSGSVDVQPITVQRGVVEYVSKMLGYELSYEHFVTPDELIRG